MHGICSSGSTGTPKIIVSALPALCHEVFSTPMMEQWRPVPRPQVMLVLAPMYHVNAFATVHNLLDGDRLVVLERFDAARAVDAIEAHQVTAFTATPTMLQRIADLPGIDDRDLSSIDWILQGAAPMPPSLVHRWADLIGPERILMAYGMTEAIGITALRGDEWMAHEGSVGRGQRGTEVRMLDDAGARACRPVRSARSSCGPRPTGAPTTSATRRSCGRPTTASRPWATWATSTRTATSTWSTGGST